MKNKEVITAVVVEDEKIIARSIVNNIENANSNFKVIGVAYDGEEGYELVRTLLPNILFTDIKMPVMDGLRLIQEVNDNFPFIKIIVVSGYDDFEYAKSAIQNNVFDYLLKPINFLELQSTLKNLQTEQRASNGHLPSVDDMKSPEEIIALVETYIHMNYAKQIDLSEIADAFGFSSAYLTKVFKDQLQTTPSKYLNNYRMMIATQLLRDTSLSVKTITEMVGFLDPFHFSKRFKHYCGLSPAQYRLEKERTIQDNNEE